MFKLRRRAKSERKLACSSSLGLKQDAPRITYEFVATFDAAGSADRHAGDDSGIYTMSLDDNFAVLRDGTESTADETARAANAAAARRVPEVIAVMLEPDGHGRFFHPEASRRAGRPIWQPLQPVEN